MKLCGILAFLLFFNTGCASIIRSSTQAIPIVSEPPGVKIEAFNEDGVLSFTGTTPTTMQLLSGSSYFDHHEYTITASKDGYQTQSIALDSEVSGWYWGNFILGGLIGLLMVDPISGAMYQLNPEQVSLTLPQAETLVTAKDAINNQATIYSSKNLIHHDSNSIIQDNSSKSKSSPIKTTTDNDLADITENMKQILTDPTPKQGGN